MDKAFDYIVVGGGTSGLVVASRLSEDADVRVLVVEAGEDRTSDPLVLTPGFAGRMCGDEKYDWNYVSAPQEMLDGRTIVQAQGRMLGGSSALNTMLIAYPSRASLDAWGKLGNAGWSFDHLEPYFRKFAGTTPPPEGSWSSGTACGRFDRKIQDSGPLKVSFGSGYNVSNFAWMKTFESLGLGMTTDVRCGAGVGAFQNGASIDPETKCRSFSASAYLTEEVRRRSNLCVATRKSAGRIILDNATSEGDIVAKAVEVIDTEGQRTVLYANREVILAAGALRTPQILELSGIGSRSLLSRHGIHTVVDNPNVGENVQDHPVVCQSFQVAPDVPTSSRLKDPALFKEAMVQYQATRDGPLGQSTLSTAYVPMVAASSPMSLQSRGELFDAHPPGQDLQRQITRQMLETQDEPGLQYLLFPSPICVPEHPVSMASLKPPPGSERCITIMTVLNHPFSRGTCHISSARVADKAIWDPRYNSEEIDMEILARGVQFVETLVTTKPLADVLQPDGKRTPPIKAGRLEDAREVVKKAMISHFHVAGSCAMKPREIGGVVDHRLRVYGVQNLRIVDASIMPMQPLGNIQSTVYAVAERAADMIKEDRRTPAAEVKTVPPASVLSRL